MVRKFNCCIIVKLFFLKIFDYSLNNRFSFEGRGSKDIGLKLVTKLELPDFLSGITVAFFQTFGKIPVLKISSKNITQFIYLREESIF